MRKLSQLIKEEANDIRNNINESVKYYSPKQAVKLLKQNLAEIPDPDERAIAIFRALNTDYYQLDWKGNKLIVKSYDESDWHAKEKSLEKRKEKFEKIKKEIFNTILDDDYIENLYNKGKDLIKKQQEIERKKAEEAAELRQTKIYKETVSKYPGLHEYVKLFTIYRYWRDDHLWSQENDDVAFYGNLNRIIKSLRSNAIPESECQEGETYMLVSGDPNMYSSKNEEAPVNRFDIIRPGSVLRCSGEELFDVVAVVTSWGLGAREWSGKKVSQKLDKYGGEPKFAKFEDFVKEFEKVYDKMLKYYIDGISTWAEISKKNVAPYIKKLIDQDTF